MSSSINQCNKPTWEMLEVATGVPCPHSCHGNCRPGQVCMHLQRQQFVLCCLANHHLALQIKDAWSINHLPAETHLPLHHNPLWWKTACWRKQRSSARSWPVPGTLRWLACKGKEETPLWHLLANGIFSQWQWPEELHYTCRTVLNGHYQC